MKLIKLFESEPPIVFDKFHILRHLSDALDGVRRAEYKRVTGDERTFIKGQRYVLLSRRENLSDGGRQNLERLLQVCFHQKTRRAPNISFCRSAPGFQGGLPQAP